MPQEEDYLEQLNKNRKNQEPTTPPTGKTPDVADISGIEFALILVLAVTKDILDWLMLGLMATGILIPIGIAIAKLTSVALAVIFGLWCLFRLKKYPTVRLGLTCVTEIVPGLGEIVPTWTLFVISLWIMQITQKHGSTMGQMAGGLTGGIINKTR